jgi:predicted  nucleic acid-binding Zn-ribbon protein
MEIESEKYGELLQEIARVMVTKNIEIEKLHEEISKLKQIISKAERKSKNGNTI